MALHTKGSDSRKAVEACLKKKLLEGAATPAWLTRALTSHQVGRYTGPGARCLAGKTWQASSSRAKGSFACGGSQLKGPHQPTWLRFLQ